MVSIVVFFIGFFPDQGITWITVTAKKALKLEGETSNETPLSSIQGLSIWQQSRLNQTGIENVQNLAAADVAGLIVGAPFGVNQIVDWVDQAILRVYASTAQFDALIEVGIRCASDVLTVAADEPRLETLQAATDLEINGLKMLHVALQSAPNIKLVSRFSWQSSMNDRASAFGKVPCRSAI